MSSRLAPFAVLLASVLLTAPATAQPPTMDELWPNQDGRSWTYAQRWEDLENPQVIDTRTRIYFDGTTVAAPDIQTQYLRQALLSGSATAMSLEPALADPFLRQLWMARPDLQTKIFRAVAQVGADAPCPSTAAPGTYAVLLQGELTYLKRPDEIAAWRCNAPNTRAWLWLVSDLTLGNTFTLQLIPDVTSDIFLHGKIAAIEPVTVPAGTFQDCVRVDYVIDYGFSECADDQGNVTGSFRSETRGRVHYAPGVGPVESFEEFILHVELIGQCVDMLPVGEPATRASMQMDSQPTPVHRTTWGRLKLVYR
jgi:hypothetical protein